MHQWALVLSAYTYEICFRPTQSHGNVDGLSQLPLWENPTSCKSDDAMVFNTAQLMLYQSTLQTSWLQLVLILC